VVKVVLYPVNLAKEETLVEIETKLDDMAEDIAAIRAILES